MSEPIFSHFTNSRVEFSRQQAKMASHVLAGETTLLVSLMVYIDVPNCTDYIIINEMIYQSFPKKNHNKSYID